MKTPTQKLLKHFPIGAKVMLPVMMVRPVREEKLMPFYVRTVGKHGVDKNNEWHQGLTSRTVTFGTAISDDGYVHGFIHGYSLEQAWNLVKNKPAKQKQL